MGGDTNVINLAEDAGETKEVGEIVDIEDSEDAVDAEAVEGDEVVEWEEIHEEAVVEVLDVRLEITGPHDPESIIGKRRDTNCMAKDR